MADNAKRRSAREAAANCLQKWHGYYGPEPHDGTNDETRRGSTFHRAAQLYIGALFQTKQRSDYELAAQAIHEAHIEFPLPQEAWLDCESIWARWIEKFELEPLEFYTAEHGGEFMGAEMRFDVVLVPLGGDRSTLRIPDWKSHWRIPPTSEVENWFQTFFYLAAARHLYPGFTRYEMVYEWVRFGTRTEPISKTNAELDAFIQRIEQIDETIARAADTGQYPATAGKHCNTCRLVCAQARPVGGVPHRLDTYEDAQLAIQEHRALTTRAQQLREVIAAYGDTNGPVRSNGIMWGHVPKDSTAYPAIPVVEALQAAKVTPQFALTISHSAIKPIFGKKYAAVGETIRALGKTVTKTEYGPKPIDDEKQEQENQ